MLLSLSMHISYVCFMVYILCFFVGDHTGPVECFYLLVRGH
jgi:hypothetical protein